MKFNGRKSMLRLLAAIMLVAFSACMDEYNENAPETDGDVRVKFAIQLPGTSTPATRALGTIDENEVTEIDVLVFNQIGEGGGLVYTVGCSENDIKTDENDSRKKTFIVELRQGKYDLVIVANAHSIITATTLTTKTKAEVQDLLTTGMPTGGKWNATKTAADYKPMPMWGDIGNETINDQTDLTGEGAVSLTRMLARVDVKVDAAVSNFTLSSVRVYNYNTHGAVVPPIAAWSKDDGKITVPTIPSDSEITEGPIIYDNKDGKTEINTTDNNCVGEIYIFESENHTDAKPEHTKAKALQDRTCIVVGGVYDSKTYYYRIDFFSKSGDTKTYLDVLRNHQYVFNIISVSGPGYDDPDVAFKSEPINIEANVLPWNQADMGNIVADGQFMMAVSQGEFVFGKDEIKTQQTNNVFYVQTDYITTAEGGKSGWYVEKIVDATDDTKDVTWVKTTSNGTTTLTKGAENIKAKVVLAVDENTDGKERDAVIWIAAGRLRYAVKVKQTIIAPLSIGLLDGNNAHVTELIFASKQGVKPASQTLTVNWQPKDADLEITNVGVGSNAFASGVGAPVTGTVLAGNNGTGTITYSIAPAAFTTAELNGNPFFEKSSKVDFVTTNSISYATANVFLRQISYNLVTDVKSGYILNSQTEKINVRANFDWTISKVTDPHDILQDEDKLLEIAGGYNTTTGNIVSFTMVAENTQTSKSGKTATITFKSQHDESTWDVVITAVEALYVGYFGGALVQKEPGVWQFERVLYVQNADEAMNVKWASTTGVVNVMGDWDGKGITLALSQMSTTDYPAANLCFQKNNNWSSITGKTSANYDWYLPAKKQLMGVYVANAGFEREEQLSGAAGANYYWSATETSGSTAWSMKSNGVSMGGISPKTSATSTRLRCVREL
ncbi:fimbrial protein [Bacteroides sp. 51]|uniref:fimbrial protein n=1 Tax=Bacteroides sp. 51 TaxID=2302938 RepID=UPI0013D10382|nr:fimbrial protein [Bacteroides sp. 51]NDV84935.1 DUF4906 domain-containing protein [Bacteroides sp. 51]